MYPYHQINTFRKKVIKRPEINVPLNAQLATNHYPFAYGFIQLLCYILANRPKGKRNRQRLLKVKDKNLNQNKGTFNLESFQKAQIVIKNLTVTSRLILQFFKRQVPVFWVMYSLPILVLLDKCLHCYTLNIDQRSQYGLFAWKLLECEVQIYSLATKYLFCKRTTLVDLRILIFVYTAKFT